MRIVTRAAAAVAAKLRTWFVGLATLAAGLAMAGQALGQAPVHPEEAQACRQTFADVQVRAAEVGDVIVADLHGADAHGLAALGHWRFDPPAFDELVIVRGGSHFPPPAPHVFVLLRGDCVVDVLPALTTPALIERAIATVLGSDT